MHVVQDLLDLLLKLSLGPDLATSVLEMNLCLSLEDGPHSLLRVQLAGVGWREQDVKVGV